MQFLYKNINNGKVKFLVQSDNHKSLVKKHFKKSVVVETVGLLADFETVPINKNKVIDINNYDVVFHGSCGYAKGVHWAIQLAKECIEYSFFFPFTYERVVEMDIKPSKNCFFYECSWETGLFELVENAKLVLCPSFWSAPIEGALIKSMIFGKKVGVVDLPTTYSSLIPADIILKLPVKVSSAVLKINSYMNSIPNTKSIKTINWLSDFLDKNRNNLECINNTVKNMKY